MSATRHISSRMKVSNTISQSYSMSTAKNNLTYAFTSKNGNKCDVRIWKRNLPKSSLSISHQKLKKNKICKASTGDASSSSSELKGSEIAEAMKGTNVIIVGDDGAANSAAAHALSTALGYSPIVTETVIEQLTKMTVQELVEEDGLAGLGGVEFVVLQDLASYTRCCVATAGGGGGAAARGDCWTHFFGAVTLWLDDGSEGSEDLPQREVYQQAEIQLKVAPAAERSGEEWTASMVKAALSGIKTMLDADEQITGKKSLYVRLGCRGDWPEFKPPGWDPANPEVNAEM
mmetsp:Transcript_33941/g.47021  ORF Transcript_33941/g.47021 Transcript_33941/m.47021 type:complete len:289 (+) Transcript_33941:64-930(+)